MSTTKDDGGPAFPIPYGEGHRDDAGKHIYTDGMSLRDHFAAQALAGMLADPDCNPSAKILAADCYEIADAMLAERAKP